VGSSDERRKILGCPPGFPKENVKNMRECFPAEVAYVCDSNSKRKTLARSLTVGAAFQIQHCDLQYKASFLVCHLNDQMNKGNTWLFGGGLGLVVYPTQDPEKMVWIGFYALGVTWKKLKRGEEMMPMMNLKNANETNFVAEIRTHWCYYRCRAWSSVQ